MSKFTRSELKDLVKECLVEILSEGLASRFDMTEASRVKRPVRHSEPSDTPLRSKSSALNSVVFGSSRGKQGPAHPTPGRQGRPGPPVSTESISGQTSDPNMSQIFADTAATTLQEQVQAESTRPGAASASELVGDPGSLFEGASNWAELAFSSPVKRN